MTRQVFDLDLARDAQSAGRWLEKAASVKAGYVVEFRPRKRSDAQNRLMWALLNKLARARPQHCGIHVDAEDYKELFLMALRKELRMMPGLDGHGLVPIGSRSSELNKEEMTTLIGLIYAFADREGVDIGPREIIENSVASEAGASAPGEGAVENPTSDSSRSSAETADPAPSNPTTPKNDHGPFPGDE